MVLLTSAQVAAVLRKELAAHGSQRRGTKERLVRFDLSHSMVTPAVTWGADAVPPEPIGWREFWATLEQCGRVGWPQMIRLPAGITRSQSLYLPSQVAEMVREVAGTLREAANLPTTGQEEDKLLVAFDSAEDGNNEPLVTLEPDEDGNYQVALATPSNLDRVPDDEADQISDYRQIVFIGAEALFTQD
jgi:hypothetical protein